MYKDTRRSDKFNRSVEHFRKAGKEMPRRGGASDKEIIFEGYTKFLESKTEIGPINIINHMKRMKTFTHYYKYPNKYYSEPRMDLDDLVNLTDEGDSDGNIKTEIIFEKEKTIQCAYSYKKNNPEKNVCILNFASAKNPGGGFLRGSMAQEESIAYVSTLYHSLITSPMYDENKKNPKNGLYNDIAIFTSEICVFKLDRDDDEYIDPVFPSVISCPAVNKNHYIKNDPDGEDTVYNTMCDRIRLIFETAKVHNVNILILGAYGCGVFGNNAVHIKEIFTGLIENDYENVFEKIIFAIPDADKFDIFSS
jgi:uncharacterized protein (TIGR02452 family)